MQNDGNIQQGCSWGEVGGGMCRAGSRRVVISPASCAPPCRQEAVYRDHSVVWGVRCMYCVVQGAGLLHYMGGRNPASSHPGLLLHAGIWTATFFNQAPVLAVVVPPIVQNNSNQLASAAAGCCDHGRLCSQTKLSPKKVAPPTGFHSTRSQVIFHQLFLQKTLPEYKSVGLLKGCRIASACAPAPLSIHRPCPWC